MRMSRRAILAAAIAIPVAGTILRPALAQEPVVYAPGGVALGGYDVVAYFTEGHAVMGSETHEIMWHGAVWRFATPEALMEFEMNPAAYAPRYGGYCAYAMAKGAVASTAPEAFTIDEGALYLNFSIAVRTIWREDIAGNVARADGYWPQALDR